MHRVTVLLSTWKEPGEVALRAAMAARSAGHDLRTTLESGLAAAELDPSLVAIGLGSLPNRDGELELDAAIMDGHDLTAGAVCGVRGIVPVISVARRVMETTPHVMLAGEQARRFAIAQGFQPVNLMTADSIARYEAWKRDPEAWEREYLHAVAPAREEHHGDTVTMLGWESPNHVVAASSTSGIAWKLPGRVGDSPIVGAGIYADDEVGCAGATGWGEELWKNVASFRTVEAMRQGLTPQAACEATLAQLNRRQPGSKRMKCAVMAISRNGEVGAAINVGEFPFWVWRDGEPEMHVIRSSD